MSFAATTWAFEQPVSVTEKVVLLALASHAGDDGECWPSMKRLVRQTNVSESTVHRALKSLAAKGLVLIEERRGENGRSRSNRYILNLNVHVSVYNNKEGVRLTPCISTGVTGDRGEGVTNDTGEGVTGDTPIRTIIKNPQKEPLTNTVDPAIEADFTEFWAAYPKRSPHANPKHSAMQSYVKARTVLKVSREAILEAAKAYAKCVAGGNPKHTAQTVTWLNQRRWGDEYDETPSNFPEAKAAVPMASDEDFQVFKKAFPGHVGKVEDAKRLLAEQMADGTTLQDLCVAADKYKLYCKGDPYDPRNLSPSMMENWLKFKWREMNGYEYFLAGADRIKAVRQTKVKK